MPDCFGSYCVSLSAPLGEPHSGVRPSADDRFGWCVGLVTGLKDAALPDGECKDLSKVVGFFKEISLGRLVKGGWGYDWFWMFLRGGSSEHYREEIGVGRQCGN